jgi:predicted SAM-dependent methyltransferase
MKLLHVAPELELESILRSNSAIDYLTADMCSNNVMEQMDLRDIQYSDCTFDAIICNHVLEHIDDDAKAISELHRVLKQAGWGILQVPISRTLAKTYEDFSIVDAKERKAAFGQADHVRIYGKDYQDRLVQAGFVVNAFRWSSEPELFGGSKNLYGLNEEEHVYAVSKEL